MQQGHPDTDVIARDSVPSNLARLPRPRRDFPEGLRAAATRVAPDYWRTRQHRLRYLLCSLASSCLRL